MLGIDSLQEVTSQLINVAVKWKFIGLQLGLKADQLDRIHADNNDVESRLNGMLKDWLRRAYDTRVCGEPSWQKLSEGVGCRAGGENPALEPDQQYQTGFISSIERLPHHRLIYGHT